MKNCPGTCDERYEELYKEVPENLPRTSRRTCRGSSKMLRRNFRDNVKHVTKTDLGAHEERSKERFGIRPRNNNVLGPMNNVTKNTPGICLSPHLTISFIDGLIWFILFCFLPSGSYYFFSKRWASQLYQICQASSHCSVQRNTVEQLRCRLQLINGLGMV